MFQLQRVGSYDSIMPEIKTVKQLRNMKRGGFVARRLNDYNRGGVWEKKYIKERIKWDSSQEELQKKMSIKRGWGF